jgi:hypothetical protein
VAVAVTVTLNVNPSYELASLLLLPFLPRPRQLQLQPQPPPSRRSRHLLHPLSSFVCLFICLTGWSHHIFFLWRIQTARLHSFRVHLKLTPLPLPSRKQDRSTFLPPLQTSTSIYLISFIHASVTCDQFLHSLQTNAVTLRPINSLHRDSLTSLPQQVCSSIPQLVYPLHIWHPCLLLLSLYPLLWSRRNNTLDWGFDFGICTRFLSWRILCKEAIKRRHLLPISYCYKNHRRLVTTTRSFDLLYHFYNSHYKSIIRAHSRSLHSFTNRLCVCRLSFLHFKLQSRPLSLFSPI